MLLSQDQDPCCEAENLKILIFILLFMFHAILIRFPLHLPLHNCYMFATLIQN